MDAGLALITFQMTHRQNYIITLKKRRSIELIVGRMKQLRKRKLIIVLSLIILFAVQLQIQGAIAMEITDVNAVGNSTATVTITWSFADGATEYKIYRSLSEDSGYMLIATVPGTKNKYDDSGLTAATTYYYKVSAVFDDVESELSDAASATTKPVAPEVPEEPYKWANVPVGGGGYVTGIVIHPAEPYLVYIRTDVGGAYRWNKENKSWVPLTDIYDLANMNRMSVDSIAVDPNNPDVVYIAVGKNADNSPSQGIQKSTDRGATWTRVGLDDKVRIYGNEAQRWGGERLAVDPNNSDIIYYASRIDGLWRCEQASLLEENPDSWVKVSDEIIGNNKQASAFIAFDKNSVADGRTQTIYAGAWNAGVFVSNDARNTWTKIPGSPAQPLRGVVASDGTLYLSHQSGVAIRTEHGRILLLRAADIRQ